MDISNSNKRQKGPDGSPVMGRPPYEAAHPTESSRHTPNSRGNATIRRPSPTSTVLNKPSIRLTVKAPPSKLRQALSNDLPPTPYEDDEGIYDTPEPPTRSARSTRNPRTVVEADSDEEEEEDVGGNQDLREDEEEEEEEDEEADEDEDEEEEEEEEEDPDADADGEIDAELLAAEDSEGDEDADADGDLDMEAPHPPPPKITTSKPASGKKGKVHVTVTAPNEGALKSVEEREEEEEELSDLDGEGEGEELDDEDEDMEDDGSDEDGSRSGTPDMTKLTRRQRATFEEGLEGGLMALSNEAQKKKHLTAEEHASRRAEMARRRKNLSEKKNEEEKMDTINKLLKKPAPKRRTRAEMIAAQSAADSNYGGEYGDAEPADPLYVRWTNNAKGSIIGVPAEWLEGPIGETLKTGWKGPPERKLVEEVA